jgi:threonine dehydrogenase-like Zn-dependent dehydrogenase
VDLIDAKLDMAKARGATHVLNAAAVTDMAAEIRKLVGDNGPDKVIETTGAKSVIELASDLTHADGTCVLVGVPSAGLRRDRFPSRAREGGIVPAISYDSLVVRPARENASVAPPCRSNIAPTVAATHKSTYRPRFVRENSGPREGIATAPLTPLPGSPPAAGRAPHSARPC